MRRQLLKDLLLEYSPKTSEEIAAKTKMLVFLDNHEDCFERSCIPGHFTASAWLLSNDMKQALLMHHTKLNRWLQLGGHCDGDHDLLNVALKEAQEESGLANIEILNPKIFDIDVHEIPAYKNDPVHLHYDVRFLFKAADDSAIVKNNESKDLRWFGPELDLFPTKELSVFRMFQKWLEFTQEPALID